MERSRQARRSESMRYLTFSRVDSPARRLGVARGHDVFDLGALAGPGASVPPSLLELIQAGPDTWQEVAALVDAALANETRAGAGRVARDQLRWHAPIPRPLKNVVCLGLNYMSHLEETSKPLNREVKVPEVPIFFTKAPTAVTGPFDS